MRFCPSAVLLLPCLALVFAGAADRTDTCSNGVCHSGEDEHAVLLQNSRVRELTKVQLSKDSTLKDPKCASLSETDPAPCPSVAGGSGAPINTGLKCVYDPACPGLDGCFEGTGCRYRSSAPLQEGAGPEHCLPSQPCWPSPEQVYALNASLDGGLYAPLATTSPTDDGFFYNVAMRDHVPSLAVHASNADDVKAAIKFADAHNIRVVVKNLGHSYRGESSGLNSLMIYTRGLSEIAIDESYNSCGSTVPAMKVGGGVVWGDVYTWMVDNGVNYSTVGGSCRSVSASGGWLQGQGLNSQIGRMHGFGVDNVLEYEIVLPSGDHVHASECSHPELFRVLRGGGGGAWGVIISVHYKLLPPSQVQFVGVGMPAADSMPLFRVIAKHAVNMDNRFQINLWFSAPSDLLAQSEQFQQFEQFINSIAEGNSTLISAVQFTFLGDVDEMYESEFMTDLASLNPSKLLVTYNNFAEMKLATSSEPMPTNYQICNAGMRIIPRSAFEDEEESIAALMFRVSFETLGCGGFYHIGGSAYDNYQTDPEATYVNPQLRNAVFVVNIDNHTFNDQWLEEWGWKGTSINHQNWDEKNWQENAWGLDNYAQLLKKKQAIDPKQLFHCRRCVGWMGD